MEREGESDSEFRYLAQDHNTRGRTSIWLQNFASQSTPPVFFPSIP